MKLSVMVLGCLSLLIGNPTVSAEFTPTDLRCEYRETPLGTDVVAPRLSWVTEAGRVEGSKRGWNQTAYQVLVASSEERLDRDQGDLWDSGKVISAQSNQLEYAGTPLTSNMRCFWKVRVWGNEATPSGWSSNGSWTMGLLKPDDWQAKWIGYDKAYHPSPEEASDNKKLNVQGLKWVQMASEHGKLSVDTCLRRALNYRRTVKSNVRW